MGGAGLEVLLRWTDGAGPDAEGGVGVERGNLRACTSPWCCFALSARARFILLLLSVGMRVLVRVLVRLRLMRAFRSHRKSSSEKRGLLHQHQLPTAGVLCFYPPDSHSAWIRSLPNVTQLSREISEEILPQFSFHHLCVLV